MPSGGFSSGLAEGIFQSHQLNTMRQRMEQDKEEISLRKKLIDAQTAMFDLEQQKFSAANQMKLQEMLMGFQGQQQLAGQVESLGQPQSLGAPLQEGALGPVAPDQPPFMEPRLANVLGAFVRAAKPGTDLKEVLTAIPGLSTAKRQNLSAVHQPGLPMGFLDPNTGEFQAAKVPEGMSSVVPAKPTDYGDRLESLAAARGFASFSDAIKRDQKQAETLRIQALVTEPTQIQAGAAQARTDIQRTTPLDLSASKYGRLGPGGVIEQPPSSLGERAAGLQGYRDLSTWKSVMDELVNVENMEPRIDRLKLYATALFQSDPGFIPRLTQASKLTAAGLGLKNEPTPLMGANGQPLMVGEVLNLYEDERRAMMEALQRSVNLIRGAGTEGDVNRGMKATSSRFASANEMATKFDDLKSDIVRTRRNTLIKIFGKQSVDQALPEPGSRLKRDLSQKPTPPDWMTPEQKEIYMKAWLKAAGEGRKP